ncbi:MAG: septum formation protein Maf [Lachnospiraceae bacterium]|nr:septum formation protein Maf [Lachnospiraceae bacterium]
MKFILASASPRRKELLTQIGMNFTVQVSEAEESADTTDPAEYVMQLSFLKAEDVAGKIPVMYDAPGIDQDFVVIGSDTVVAAEGEIMGKPVDDEDAARMLRKLAGNTHQVYTGVTLFCFRNGRLERNTFYEKTDVTMYDMTEEDIKDYVSSGECRDKAGSYAIQGLCAAYIKSIQGEYASVVGLPVARICYELKKMGIRWRE